MCEIKNETTTYMKTIFKVWRSKKIIINCAKISYLLYAENISTKSHCLKENSDFLFPVDWMNLLYDWTKTRSNKRERFHWFPAESKVLYILNT